MSRAVTHEGVTLSISDWARRTGIERNTINCRLKRGWSVAEALTIPSERDGLVTYQGRTQTHAAWAKELGMSLAGFHHRLERGMSVEQAIEKPVQVKRKKVRT